MQGASATIGTEMNDDDGLIAAYLLDGIGGAQAYDWQQILAWRPEAGVLWVHLDYTRDNARRWVREHSGLDPLVADNLLQEETRPRSAPLSDGLLVLLRGVNMNPNAEPEDMVSIRIWANQNRIVTTRHRHLLSVDDLRAAIAAGRGPRGAGEFLVQISDRMVVRMADVIDGIDEHVAELEDQILVFESHRLRPLLADVRRQIISLRRYLAPQREAMARLTQERVEWLSDQDRLRLREVGDRVTRYVEDLDAARDRAAVTQEELNSRLSEQMDRRMYVLSIVAAIFLPLGFVTGLLGINVGGIPGAEFRYGFLLVCLLLGGLAAVQFWILRRRRWM